MGLIWTYYTNSNRIHQNELNRLKSQQAGGRPVWDRQAQGSSTKPKLSMYIDWKGNSAIKGSYSSVDAALSLTK